MRFRLSNRTMSANQKAPKKVLAGGGQFSVESDSEWTCRRCWLRKFYCAVSNFDHILSLNL